VELTDLLDLRVSDAINLLESIKDESVDLIILDPYYNDWDKFIERGLINESLRCLKESGNLICFTQQPFDFNIRQQCVENFRREIIWNYSKRPKWVSKRLPLVYHQKILWFVKSKKKHFFNCRSGMEYSENTVFGNKGFMVFEGYKERLGHYEKHPNGVWLPDVLTFDKPFKTLHKGQKPIELIEVILRCFSPADGVVLDPFIGFGTTVYASQGSERKIIGGDIDDIYFQDIISTVMSK